MELTPALGDRRRSVAAKASGRVLDLGGWRDHLGAYRLGTAVGEVSDVVMLVRPGDLRAGDSGSGPGSDPAGVTRLDASFDELVGLGVEPFDTIVSLIRMPLISDLDRFLASVLQLLSGEGDLLLLEPVGRAGRMGGMGGMGRLLTLGGSLMNAAGGLHLDRDIPARLRDANMLVTDLERFEVPAVSAPFRSFVEARARRPFSSPR